MRRTGMFFGLFIILLGAILLGLNLGYVDNRIWNFFWPAMLVLLGAWFLLRPRLSSTPLTVEQASYPLNMAAEGEISIHYGAGRLTLGESTNPGELAGGSFAGGVLADQSRQGSKAVLSLRTPSERIFEGPWTTDSKGFEWNMGINGQIPLDLHLHTGANEQILDLARTQVKNLVLETGASHSVVTLPQSAGFTRATIISGLAEVNVTVPEGVAAVIHVNAGLSGIKVDEARFPRAGEQYQSLDYQTAVNKVEVHIETGLGSVNIR